MTRLLKPRFLLTAVGVALLALAGLISACPFRCPDWAWAAPMSAGILLVVFVLGCGSTCSSEETDA